MHGESHVRDFARVACRRAYGIDAGAPIDVGHRAPQVDGRLAHVAASGMGGAHRITDDCAQLVVAREPQRVFGDQRDVHAPPRQMREGASALCCTRTCTRTWILKLLYVRREVHVIAPAMHVIAAGSIRLSARATAAPNGSRATSGALINSAADGRRRSRRLMHRARRTGHRLDAFAAHLLRGDHINDRQRRDPRTGSSRR